MRKLSKIWAAMLCAILMFVCAVPASAGAQKETKTKSLDVMLVVDDTVSMQRNDPNHIASLALEKFVERIPGEGSRVGMATYDDDILTSTASLTGTDQPMMRVMELGDKERLREYARTGLTQDGRFTDLPGALYYAAMQIRRLPPMDAIPAIIAVSDGENDFINAAAREHSDKMLEEVLGADIPVYLIVIHASDRTDVRDYMQGIADATEGKAFFVDSGDQVDESLVEIANELYGLEPELDNELNTVIDLDPVDWPFSLPTGVFEATVELTHEMDLEMELYGPGGAEIPLRGNQNVAVSSMQDRSGLKTIIRLVEPDEGKYFLRLSSPLGQQPVVGEIILNNEIYVQVALSPNAAGGDEVEVTATLMRGVSQYTDLEFANLSATVSIDGQSEDMERDEDEGVFRYKLAVPDDQENDLELIVTVQGQKSFLRSSDPVTLAIGNPPPIKADPDKVYVQAALSPNPAKRGAKVEVTARLMLSGKPYTDVEFATLNATVSIDGKSEDMEGNEDKSVFRYNLTVPDQENSLQLVVTVQGPDGLLLSSNPVTLTIDKNGGPSIWMIVLAAALLLIIIAIIIVLILRSRGGAGVKSKYIRLQGTLTVRYYDDMHQFIWERYVRPGSGFTKRNPRESLGKMLRDQQQDYGDVPEYFDKIFIAGLQYGDSKLCVEVTGELDSPSGPEKINRRIDIANGRGMDDMEDMGFFGGASSTAIIFPDGRQAEMEFTL